MATSAMHAAGSSRMRLSQFTSSLGAGVAGLGLGVLLSRVLDGLGVVILLTGTAMHAWGMLDGMRLEKEMAVTRPRWSLATYWLCWLLLGVLALYVLATAVRR